jgi:hypothetical protein
MSKHNQTQIHVRSTSGKYRPGTTAPPQGSASTPLSPKEQAFLGQGVIPDPAECEVPEAVDFVEVVSGSMHTDEGDSTDPSGQQ